MKKLFILIFIFFTTLNAYSQTGIFFQAIARDNFSNPAKDREIYVLTNIIQSSPTGTIVLTEEHKTSTDAYGIFNIMVGSGRRVGGTVTGLSTIDWSKGPYYFNIKIVITPIAASSTWDYTKEWVDIGTTIFGTVPFALYSANTAKIDEKLNTTDTSKMLEPYAKEKMVQILSTIIDTKLATKDTASMLAPYAKLSYNLDSNYLKKQIASLLGALDTIKYTKQTYTDSALLTKMNMFDKSIYAKQAYVDTINYIQQKFIDSSLQTKFNLADTIKYTKKAYTDSALLTKMNVFDTSIYARQVFVDSVNYIQQKFIENSLQMKFNLADTIKYTKQIYTDSALLTKLSITGSAASLTNFPILNQNTTGNAATADNITATNNTTLTSLSNLNTVGTITTGVWSATTIDIAHGGTGLTKAGLTGQALTTSATGTLTWTNVSTPDVHFIGESYGGGIVFYVYDNGKHGLIAATSDQILNTRWYGGSNTNTRARADGVGAGFKNTSIIIAVQSGTYTPAYDGAEFAATVCNEYSVTINGVTYGDWYLPSKHELNLLFLQRAIVGNFPNVSGSYWSSTEYFRSDLVGSNQSAWYQNFINGLQTYVHKKNIFSVRAIRAF